MILTRLSILLSTGVCETSTPFEMPLVWNRPYYLDTNRRGESRGEKLTELGLAATEVRAQRCTCTTRFEPNIGQDACDMFPACDPPEGISFSNELICCFLFKSTSIKVVPPVLDKWVPLKTCKRNAQLHVRISKYNDFILICYNHEYHEHTISR